MDKRINRGTEREQAVFFGKLYGRLVGATVVAFEWDGELPIFIVRLANGQRREIAIQQDPEGNGPGFIAGLED
ncbi:MAG TPA: hypothetical protein VGV60_11240 [Candidatus Polarisedimenticolia bacterium]|jgi:hypothetical protein|nr:hypothetical protein [Nitrospirales bacterium]HEV8701834.1 hypothetical protein [Candidatus Polarisedimenticolia bacterium]